MKIDGRVAIVTGAGRGIGRATAGALAERGASIVVVDVSGVRADDAAQELRDLGSRAVSVMADVSTVAGVEAMFRVAEEAFGGVDIVHNNAGIIGTTYWPDIPLDVALQTVAVNVGGVVLGMLGALSALRRRGGGVIVNTASIAGTTPNEIVPLYAATKAAVISLTKGAAPAALAMGIRINAVAPALVDTEFAQMLIPPDPPAWMVPLLIDRIAPLEVAEAVLSLVEDDSRSGEVLIVANRPPVDRIGTPA